ncbi:MAG: hypothetical protein OEN23_14120 [Paracoccaceae bacterium]|nr:hypothetical protein [Paracoccaceae bacterium]
MLKDDRMMSMLTVVVILIAIGTLVQRMDVFEKYFGGETQRFAHVADEVIVRANVLSDIDVLANDQGIEEGDADRLLIIAQPDCGRVFAEEGLAHYMPADRCVGVQTFYYAVNGRGNQPGEVRVTVRLGEVTESMVENAQRDTPAPQPQAPSTEVQAAADATTAPAAPTAPQGSLTTSGAVAQAPAVPKPEAPTITELPASARGASLGGSGSGAGIARESAGAAPRVVDTTDALAGEQVSAATPEVALTRTPDSTAAPDAAADPQGSAEGVAAGASELGPDQESAPDPQASVPAEIAAATPESGAGEAAAGQDQASGTAAVTPIEETQDSPATIRRAEPQELADAAATEPGSEAPDEAVAVLRESEAANLAPNVTRVDTTPPPELKDPDAASAPAPQEETSGTQVAARPPSAEPCTVPASLTLDVRAAAITYAIIESPCHAGTVAELGYEGLRFAIPIDGAGTGTIAAPGFQNASDATIRFADDARLNFSIAFNDTEKMDRVAVATEAATELQLHAFEFGAAPGGPDHVGPANPRRHDDVRRSGGGYLLEYAPVDGTGQSVEIYTFWHRRRGGEGIVRLDLGLGRDSGPAAGCGGGGAGGTPDYVVLRTQKGKLLRPRLGLLAPIDCAALAASGGFVPDAIDDIVVRKR